MQPSDPSISDMHITPNAPSPAVKNKSAETDIKIISIFISFIHSEGQSH